jgi:hypothetical protein
MKHLFLVILIMNIMIVLVCTFCCHYSVHSFSSGFSQNSMWEAGVLTVILFLILVLFYSDRLASKYHCLRLIGCQSVVNCVWTLYFRYQSYLYGWRRRAASGERRAAGGNHGRTPGIFKSPSEAPGDNKMLKLAATSIDGPLFEILLTKNAFSNCWKWGTI